MECGVAANVRLALVPLSIRRQRRFFLPGWISPMP